MQRTCGSFFFLGHNSVYDLRIFSIAFPFASSSTSLSK
jgi:hypothetical protein